MDKQVEIEAGRFRRLRGWTTGLRMLVTRAIRGTASLYRLKSGLMLMQFALLCLGSALLSSACAHNDDSSADSSQHRRHRRGGYGQGQGGTSDRSNIFGSPTQCRASEARTEVKRNSERTRSPNAQSRGALLVVTVRRLSDRSGDDGVDKVRASTSFRSDCTALRSAKLLAAASELPGCSRYSACPAAPACNQVTTMISCPTTMSCSPSAKRGLTSSQASGAPSEPCLDASSRLFISERMNPIG